MDRDSLRKCYRSVIREFRVDIWYGKLVFMFNRITFSSPILSRILYQAVITERKTRIKRYRRLEDIVWRIASGDDKYRNIFFAMFHPVTISSILIGGVLITLRNYLTELLFGLKWQGFGRYPTGIYKEALEAKRREFAKNLDMHQLKRHPELERIYSIRIRADRQKILYQLGKFGDEDRQYFRPRMIKVYRISGAANEVGSLIQYDTFFKFFSFSLILARIIGNRYYIYNVRDGFARDGVLVFDIDETRGADSFFSIYVAFDFPKGENLLDKLFWKIFRLIFPGFIHDVLWNHSLCKLKDIIEMAEEECSEEPDERTSNNNIFSSPTINTKDFLEK